VSCVWLVAGHGRSHPMPNTTPMRSVVEGIQGAGPQNVVCVVCGGHGRAMWLWLAR
jgi:hypothetical protein